MSTNGKRSSVKGTVLSLQRPHDVGALGVGVGLTFGLSMGIHGIYQEIGKGTRIALLKYATQTFEEKSRPLRIAIDTSIWLFQIQSSKGGTNPALRTFYYRLLRLINHTIHPIFVFDGPNKPPYKRNKRTGPNVASIPEFLAKQLLKMFGFPIHVAPGEAEAECALLQREGIVDAVLTEDVDAIMFGSGITLRSWSPEQKSSKVPTHVNLYDAGKIKAGSSKLDREGMILVALMSGGDYLPEGIPNCGPKTACEAARAGFGHDLCKLLRTDTAGRKAWKKRLSHELVTNESKYFRQKHGKLVIPEDFPRLDIMGYYTHPAVSSPEAIVRLQNKIQWDQPIDFPALREFTKDAFDWTKLGGAKHFVRTLAPAVLIRELRLRAEKTAAHPSDDLNQTAEEETLLVRTIHATRQHGTTDLTQEIRVGFIPNDLVTIDLDAEEPDDELPEEDSEVEEELPLIDANDFTALDSTAGPKKRGPTKYDPATLERIWVPEIIVKSGVPLKMEDWEASKRNAITLLQQRAQTEATTKALTKTTRTRKPSKGNGMRGGELDRFTRVTKPGAAVPTKMTTLSRTNANCSSTSKAPPPSTAPPLQSISLLSSPPTTPSKSRQSTLDRFLSPSKDRVAPPVFEISSSPVKSTEGQPVETTRRRNRDGFRRVQTMPVDLSPIHSEHERSCSPDPDLPSPRRFSRKRSRPSPPTQPRVNLAIEVLDLAATSRSPLGMISGNRNLNGRIRKPGLEEMRCLDLTGESTVTKANTHADQQLSSDLIGKSDLISTSDFLVSEKGTTDLNSKSRSAEQQSSEIVPSCDRIASSDFLALEKASEDPTRSVFPEQIQMHIPTTINRHIQQSSPFPSTSTAPIPAVSTLELPKSPTAPLCSPNLYIRSHESLPGHWKWSTGTSPEALRLLSTCTSPPLPAFSSSTKPKTKPQSNKRSAQRRRIFKTSSVQVLDLTGGTSTPKHCSASTQSGDTIHPSTGVQSVGRMIAASTAATTNHDIPTPPDSTPPLLPRPLATSREKSPQLPHAIITLPLLNLPLPSNVPESGSLVSEPPNGELHTDDEDGRDKAGEEMVMAMSANVTLSPQRRKRRTAAARNREECERQIHTQARRTLRKDAGTTSRGGGSSISGGSRIASAYVVDLT